MLPALLCVVTTQFLCHQSETLNSVTRMVTAAESLSSWVSDDHRGLRYILRNWNCQVIRLSDHSV